MATFAVSDYDEPELDDVELGYRSDGQPTLMVLGNAIQCWSLLQRRPRVTIGETALAFNITPERVAEAIDFHPWLLNLDDGPLSERAIEHEGE